MAKITISRDKGWADKIRNYIIVLNGQEAGTIGEGKEIELNLENGNYELYAKIDWCSSNKLKFSILNSNDEKKVMVKSSLRGFRIFLASLYVFFAPTKYLEIEEI
jgi:hypothetical protein